MLYYFDTSIWLDIFEDRDEPNLPKSKYAEKLIFKIVENHDKIIFSNIIIKELMDYGYTYYEIWCLLEKFRNTIIYTRSTDKQFGKAKDLAHKRDVPRFDALHAILARDNNAVLITRDYHHFNKLKDIISFYKPENLI